MNDRDRREDQLGLFGDGPAEGDRSSKPKTPAGGGVTAQGASSQDPGPDADPDAGPDAGSDPSRREAALEQDRAARALAQSEFRRPLLVEAGAGTGKTTTLTARILAWSLGPGWQRGAARVAEREAAARPLAVPAEPDPEAVAAEVLSRVVAITFTEAAAGEMASRMGEALAGLAGDEAEPPWLLADNLPPEPERSRRARALLGALDHLVVRTIHAFCRSLLAAYPLEAGLHPELQVDPDGFRVEEIVREVVEDRLREGYQEQGEQGDPDLLALAASGVGPAEMVEAVVDALVRENLRPEDLEASPFAPERIEALRADLLEAVRRFEQAAAGRLDGLARSKKTGEALEAIRSCARLAQGLEETEETDPGDDGLPAFDRLCSTLADTWDGRLRDRLKAWARADFNKTEAGALGEGGDPKLVAEAAGRLLARVDELRRLRPALLERARRALAPMLAECRRQMRVRGLATFHDLLAEARDLLARRPDVAGRVRRRIDQLLVDELQDTDRLQVEVITAIALPAPERPEGPEGPEGPAEKDDQRPGLFLVGDPKQSIYGWRNADLRAYEALWERVRATGGLKVSLAENFRSVPAILDEVARAVEPVMLEQPGVQPRFEPLVPCGRLAGEAGFARERWAPVEYWVSWTDRDLAATRSSDATLLEAAAIARDLRRLRERPRLDSDEAFSWGQAALLLRSFSDLDDYLEALRREGVPFAVTGDRQYYRRREVIDAAALVRSVIDPGDHLALLTVLRSPAVGVPDAALIPLWQEGFPRRMTELAGPRPDALKALQEAIEGALGRMPASETVPGLDRVAGWNRVLLATVHALARLRKSFAEDPADRFVEHLRTLVPLELVASARHLGHYRLANLDRFFRRLTESMESSAGDATAILRSLRRGVSEALEEEEGRPRGAGEAEDAVQVMTIHKAKGLDFAHVYLAQLHKGSPRNGLPHVAAGAVREGAAPENADGGPGGRRVEYCLFGAPTPGFAAVEEERRRVEAAERVRTLYVAMTRAEERLVLAGRWPETPRPRAPEAADSYLDLLGSRFPSDLDLGEVWSALDIETGTGGAGKDRVDRHRVRWVFPGLAAADRETEVGHAVEREAEAPALPAPKAVRTDSERLRELRKEAASRQQRPLSGRASPKDQSSREMGEEPSRPSRDATPGQSSVSRRRSQTVGTVIHRLLENLDLTGNPTRTDLIDRLQAARARIPSLVASDLPPAEQEAARSEAEEVLDLFLRGWGDDLLERLASIAGNVIARELPILAPPETLSELADEKPIAFVSGTIDLVYRDPEKAELVVADYKTNRIDDSGNVEAWIKDQRAHYAPQLRTYSRAIQEAFGLPKPPRAELWFLWPGRIEIVGP